MDMPETQPTNVPQVNDNDTSVSLPSADNLTSTESATPPVDPMVVDTSKRVLKKHPTTSVRRNIRAILRRRIWRNGVLLALLFGLGMIIALDKADNISAVITLMGSFVSLYNGFSKRNQLPKFISININRFLKLSLTTPSIVLLMTVILYALFFLPWLRLLVASNKPMVTFTSDIAVWPQPTISYPPVILPALTPYLVLGRSPDEDWYQISLPDGVLMWFPADRLDQQTGDFSRVQVIIPSSTPTPVPTFTPPPTDSPIPTATNKPTDQPSNTPIPTTPPTETASPPTPTATCCVTPSPVPTATPLPGWTWIQFPNGHFQIQVDPVSVQDYLQFAQSDLFKEKLSGKGVESAAFISMTPTPNSPAPYQNVNGYAADLYCREWLPKQNLTPDILYRLPTLDELNAASPSIQKYPDTNELLYSGQVDMPAGVRYNASGTPAPVFVENAYQEGFLFRCIALP
ncbi:MAG: hypothetical protein K8L97_13085 [Anaerolineae bacterium]|nr:hypothetical protein [Anaerolineae bacterium]